MHYELSPPPVAEVVAPKPAENTGVGGGCLLAIVAIIVAAIVAAIIVAIALPVYQGMVEEAKWSEGAAGAATIKTALDVHKAKNSGQLPGIGNGPALDYADTLRLSMWDFDEFRHFNASDFFLTEVDAEHGTYCIEVQSSAADGPRGIYRLWYDGSSSLER